MCSRDLWSLNDAHTNNLDHDEYLCCQVLFINNIKIWGIAYTIPDLHVDCLHMSQYVWSHSLLSVRYIKNIFRTDRLHTYILCSYVLYALLSEHHYLHGAF